MNLKVLYPIVVTLIFVHNKCASQIKDIKVGDNLIVTKLYGRVNSKIIVPTDSLTTTNDVSFRAGAEVIMDLSSTFTLKSLGVSQANSGRSTGSIATFEFITKINETLQLNVGLLPGPTTKLRPNPVTWQGHTELYTQSRITGTEPGVALKFDPKGKLFFSYGLLNQNEVWTSKARVVIGDINLAGFYQTDDEYFAVVDYTKGKFKVVTNYSSQFDELAFGCFVPVRESIIIYTDVNYLFDRDRSDVTRFGIRNHFEHPDILVRGFFALEYEFEGQYFTTQLMIHL